MTVLCDLDGVVYRGDRLVPGADRGLTRLAGAGVEVYFITNNSTRTPETAADKITRLTGVVVAPDHVLTSSLAAVALLQPEDGPVMVVGGEGVADAVARAGLEVTDDPVTAGSVMVGLTRDLNYDMIAAASEAVRRGARFIATNVDATYPTENGVVPGSGAIVAAIATAAERKPEIAGKPHPPMRRLIRSRGVGPAWVIGDRVETDVALAEAEEDWTSILVLTGVTDTEASAAAGADHVVADVAAAVDLVLAARLPS